MPPPRPSPPSPPSPPAGSPARLARVRPGAAAAPRQAGAHPRDGDDREAGRLRRAGQHDAAVDRPGGPLDGRDLPAHRAQVVLLGPDERRLPRARADRRRRRLLPRAPRARRRHAATRSALQRLKDKLGNRSNASSEIELEGTWAVRVGEEGRGIRTIIDMVASTRLDCVLGSTATMRAALVRAVHHARHRSAFGALLVDQPLMRNVLADLALESEAATVLGDAARPRRRRRRARPRRASASPSASSGCASGPRRWSPRRWSASAATATSRRTGSPASTARRRSTRSGRARATSTRSTSCGP